MKTQRFCSDPCKLKGRYRRGVKCADLSPTDAAYIAGLIDGEGSIMLVKRSVLGGIHLRVVVSNTHKGVLEWLTSTTGIGRTYKLREGSATHKATYAWRAHGDGAFTLLQQIAPYLHIKPEQADLGIKAHAWLTVPSMKSDLAWQEEWAMKMKVLNARGTYSMTATSGG